MNMPTQYERKVVRIYGGIDLDLAVSFNLPEQ